MKINKNLSLKRCWDMVNNIQRANTPQEIRERCQIAEEWLRQNEVITNEEWDDLMMAVSFIHRESYHMG